MMNGLKRLTITNKELNQKILSRLLNFQNANKLKKTILAYLASRANDEEIKDEIDLFNEVDNNHDGYITVKELRKALKQSSSDPNDITGIMKHIDIDNNGAINFNEFIAATLSNYITKDFEKLALAFKFFDKDNDGYINDKELKACLAGSEFKHIDTKIFTDVLDECKPKVKGKIAFNEFISLMSVKIEDSIPNINLSSSNIKSLHFQ